MTPLEARIASQVSATGPMTIADYMALCLLHPEHGYYRKGHPVGASGDFITAPEISQMFGELIGLALAQAWLDQGAPQPFALAELGPGRGTLMADILRAGAQVPGFAEAEVHLVEVSETLRAEQATRIPTATWHEDVSALPEMPLFLVANELFDALPVRQFIRDEDGWRERVVGLREGTLAFGLSDLLPPETVPDRTVATGEMVEVSAASTAIAQTLGEKIAANGGAALIIDYGDDAPVGDTFQAVARHEKVAPLAAPGEADLTAHVDFAALARAAAPALVSPTTPQGLFLARLGIEQRAATLAKGMTEDALGAHHAAFTRLTAPSEMGHLFKVLGLRAPGTPPLPGLDE